MERKEKIVGYAAMAKGQKLEPFGYPLPELGKGEVRVSVTHCGVCHSDLHAIENYYGVVKFPFVPGHEIVGTVSELGPGASELNIGDRVGIGWQGRSCGKCQWCLQGEEQLCRQIADAGVWTPYGGFSPSVVVSQRFAYRLPPKMESHVAAVLMCAGLAVFTPLRKHAVGQDRKIAIVGVGGLGHLAIQFAHAMRCDVTVISSSPEKKEVAMKYGADSFIDSGNRTQMASAEHTFDLLLCTASGGTDWDMLLETLKWRGKVVLVGFPNISFNTTPLVVHELTIAGSFLGTRAAMKEMLEFAHAHGIRPETELMPMSRVNEAVERVKAGKARYRIVLVNELG
jgi:uncharacterized zinc-type alcohol dehydrogenase-like protein